MREVKDQNMFLFTVQSPLISHYKDYITDHITDD